MPYQISAEQLASITDLDLAFATTRYLPPWDEIPDEFKQGNRYTEVAEAIFKSSALPDWEIELKDGIEAEALNRCVYAHLRSFGPSHEHKIAGVGFMISCVATLPPELAPIARAES